MHAARIASLWWLLLAVCTVIFILFTTAALYAMLHRRRDRADEAADPDAEQRTPALWVVLAGAVIPACIVAVLIVITLAAMRAIGVTEDARVVIEVDGRLWWWELRYLDERGGVIAVSANEMRVPVGEPVELRLVSDNVIHSFWAPQLHGKLDLVPGKANVLTIQADRAGTYRGFCAEYCGLQHARMGFLVVALPRPEFDAWLTREAAPALPPATPALARGRGTFQEVCGTCHTVRGTPAQGTEGPDLTHIASRGTLAAATLSNDTATLSAWIGNAQSLKPGTLMPDVDLAADQQRDIVAYLMSLR